MSTNDAPDVHATPNVQAAELFERARKTLANKSDSYVRDAKLFAKAILLLEPYVLLGTIELEVEGEA
jgi:hypothetical protein